MCETSNACICGPTHESKWPTLLSKKIIIIFAAQNNSKTVQVYASGWSIRWENRQKTTHMLHAYQLIAAHNLRQDAFITAIE